ncbi:MAG: hypothetical protein LUC17_01335 [Oscillospiraceae bacterium]|nr:hypothetical protein [Oscillospiraceae bacterium]
MKRSYIVKASMEAKKTKIESASKIENEKLADAVNTLTEDFDYMISGIEKLSRSGAQAGNDAMDIVENISNAVNEAIVQIAGSVKE